MDADKSRVLDILETSKYLQVPIFQRHFDWTDAQCQRLWDDIMRVGHASRAHSGASHFLGAIVYVLDEAEDRASRKHLVVDGQQRLTTLTLLLHALSESIQDRPEPPKSDFSSDQIRNSFLVNRDLVEDRHRKLHLSDSDDATLTRIIGTEDNPHSEAPPDNATAYPLWQAFQHFAKRCVKASDSELRQLCDGLDRLWVVEIKLDQHTDKPHLIYECLNSTGLDLTNSDLIKNYVLMSLDKDSQDTLYNVHWKPMEQAFRNANKHRKFDGFIRHFLTIRNNGDIPLKAKVYETFKDYTNRELLGSKTMFDVILDLSTHSDYFLRIDAGLEPATPLRDALNDLARLRVDVAHPLLLSLYSLYTSGSLSAMDLFHIVRLIESYVFRRIVCELAPSSLNKTFAQLSQTIDTNAPLESLALAFLSYQTYRRFPTDEEFDAALRNRDMYKIRSLKYWLHRLENHEREGVLRTNELTVEHIMPQSRRLSDEWKSDLGQDDWRRVQRQYINVLGNLTLTGYNSQLSDKPFIEKRDADKGFRSGNLKLNEGLVNLPSWNEDTIKQRTDQMASLAVKAWPYPSPQMGASGVAQAPNVPFGLAESDCVLVFSNEHVRHLFSSLQLGICQIDATISATNLGDRVKFSAIDPLVYVYADDKELRLAIQVDASTLNDPQKLCEVISDNLEWGTRDGARVAISRLDQLPAAMDIIRQAYDAQVG